MTLILCGVLNVLYDGCGVTPDAFHAGGSYNAIRPVVCLNSDINATQVNGVWKLEKGASNVKFDKVSATTDFKYKKDQEKTADNLIGTAVLKVTPDSEESVTLEADDIKVIVNGVEVTDGSVSISVSENTSSLEKNIIVSGFKASDKQVKVQVGTNEENKFIAYNTIKQRTDTSNFFGVDGGGFIISFSQKTKEEIEKIKENVETDTIPSHKFYDISAMQDESIVLESIGATTARCDIISADEIYANSDSSLLFSNIDVTEPIGDAEMVVGSYFNTNNVINMERMFYNSYSSSRLYVVNLSLGDNFDTSNVTNMESMFEKLGTNKMTSLYLGEKFDTSNVKNMKNMFNGCGSVAMTSIDFGGAFQNIASEHSNMFDTCGKENENVIYCNEEIYKDIHNFKLNKDSTETINYERGTINIKNTTGNSLYSKITANNFGDYVDYPIDLNEDGNTKNDWRIFYKNNGEGTNDVFLIAADYVDWSKNTLNTDAMSQDTSYEPYDVYWSDSNLSSASSSLNSSKFLYSQMTQLKTSNSNFKAVSNLLNTGYWSNFVNGTYATSAIGSPTVEMFMNSWNEKFSGDANYSTLNCKYNYSSSGSGYYVGTGTSTPTSIVIDKEITGYNQTNSKLYWPEISAVTSGSGICHGYWLASPSAYDSESILGVGYSGAIIAPNYDIRGNGTGLAVRPVVCLISNINATQVNGVWRLEKGESTAKYNKVSATTDFKYKENEEKTANTLIGTAIVKVKPDSEENVTLKADDIKVILNGSEVTDGSISISVSENTSSSEKNVIVSGFKASDNQVKVQIGALDTNIFIAYNVMENDFSDFDYGIEVGSNEYKEYLIGNIVFGENINNANNTKRDISAQKDESIVAWFIKNGTSKYGAYDVYIASSDEIYAPTDSSGLFSEMAYLKSFKNLEKLNVNNVSNMAYMFGASTSQSITNLDLGNNFNTSNVVSMNNMFRTQGSLTTLNLGEKFDTSNVTDMGEMFAWTHNMMNLSLGNKFDTSNVTNMNGMFRFCGQNAMTTLNLGEKFNTNSVTNMQEMFMYCGQTSLVTLDLGSGFENISAISNNTFLGCGNSSTIIYVPENIYLSEHSLNKNGTTFWLKDDEGEVTITNAKIKKRENATSSSLYSKITASNFGDYVNYPVDLNGDANLTNDWRIFYKNNEEGTNNVFLIAADYVDWTKNTLNTNAMSQNASYKPYNVYWSDSNLSNALSSLNASKFLHSQMTQLKTSNINFKATSNLLNTSYWNSFVNSTYASSAIGSPTVEMFMNSWNEKFSGDSNYSTLSYNYDYSSSGSGYYVGKGTGTSTSTSILVTGYNKTGADLYWSHTSTVTSGSGSCKGYWLASPSAYGSSDVLSVLCEGGVYDCGYGNLSDIGVRPVVCLRSNINATQENGVWKLAGTTTDSTNSGTTNNNTSSSTNNNTGSSVSSTPNSTTPKDSVSSQSTTSETKVTTSSNEKEVSVGSNAEQATNNVNNEVSANNGVANNNDKEVSRSDYENTEISSEKSIIQAGIKLLSNSIGSITANVIDTIIFKNPVTAALSVLKLIYEISPFAELFSNK